MTSYTHEKEQNSIAVEDSLQGCFKVPWIRKRVIYYKAKHCNIKRKLKVVLNLKRTTKQHPGTTHRSSPKDDKGLDRFR